MQKDSLAILNDTLSIFRQGYYDIEGRRIRLTLSRLERERIAVYLPEDVKRISECTRFRHHRIIWRTQVSCVNKDAFMFAREQTLSIRASFHKKDLPVLVLNLANPYEPGGGVYRGAKAQEEDLCRKSSLLFSLESEKAQTYYSFNKSLKSRMGSDAMMITPKVEIIKDENGNLLPGSVIVSVMTCAAPIISYGKEGLTEAEYRAIVFSRITGMLKLAAYLGYKFLVLGAFGCGAFGNDAKVVSDLFYQAMKQFNYNGMGISDYFFSIDFAVMDHSASQYNYEEFSRNFNYFYCEPCGNK